MEKERPRRYTGALKPYARWLLITWKTEYDVQVSAVVNTRKNRNPLSTMFKRKGVFCHKSQEVAAVSLTRHQHSGLLRPTVPVEVGVCSRLRQVTPAVKKPNGMAHTVVINECRLSRDSFPLPSHTASLGCNLAIRMLSDR